MKCASPLDRVARRAEQRLDGMDDGVDHGLVAGGVAQRAELVDLSGREIGVQLLQFVGVAVLELGPQVLTDAGEQSVGGAERFVSTRKSAGHLVGLQVGELARRPDSD